MDLYCRCGHPIVVSARWEGQNLRISLHDGAHQKPDEHIFACPQCGASVTLGVLRPRAPHTAHWFTWQDAQTEDELDEQAEDAG